MVDTSRDKHGRAGFLGKILSTIRSIFIPGAQNSSIFIDHWSKIAAIIGTAFTILGTAFTILTFKPTPPATVNTIFIPDPLSFDVAICQQNQFSPKQKINKPLIRGIVGVLRPNIRECLIKHWLPTSTGQVALTIGVNVKNQQVASTVSSINVSPTGKKCIERIVETHIRSIIPPNHIQSETDKVSLHYELVKKSSSDIDINEGINVAELLRINQTSWCDCYKKYLDFVPPTLNISVHLKKDKNVPVDVGLGQLDDPENSYLIVCLKNKILQTRIQTKLNSDEVKFHYQLVHFNSRSVRPSMHLPHGQRYFQLDLEYGQQTANALIAQGERDIIAEVYNSFVSKAHQEVDHTMTAQSSEICRQLVSLSQKLVEIRRKQISTNSNILSIVQELKDQNPEWRRTELDEEETASKLKDELNKDQTYLNRIRASCLESDR